MVHWTKKVVMSLGTFKWATANAWAGQMVKATNGKYYWYVPVQDSGGAMALGVAVATNPAGPWTDAIGRPLIDDAFEMSNLGLGTPSDREFGPPGKATSGPSSRSGLSRLRRSPR
jgi:hypothetical protein